jgi:hypothetical protein
MNSIVSASFDYGALESDKAQIIRAVAMEIKSSTGRQLKEIIATGAALMRVKDVIPHGEFGKWLATEFGWSERTAQNYMRVADEFGENPQRVADLPLRCVYLISATSTPESARDQVLELIKNGDRPTERQIYDIVRGRIDERKRAANEKRRDEARKAKAPEQLEREAKAKKRREVREAKEEAKRKREEEAVQAGAKRLADRVREVLPEEIGNLIRFCDDLQFRLAVRAALSGTEARHG